MGKLKISKRLKNPFKKQASGGSILSDENRGVASVAIKDFASPIASPAALQAAPAISSPIPNILSIETTGSNSSAAASSLNSEQRDHGPIDIDSCRKYNGGKSKNEGMGEGRNSFKKIRGGSIRKKGRGGSLMAVGDSATAGLPKIVESRSATPASLSMSFNSGPETPGSAPVTGASPIYKGSGPTPPTSPVDGMGGGSPVSSISENGAALSSVIHGSPHGSVVGSGVGSTLSSSEQKRQLARELSQQSAGSERKQHIARERSLQSSRSTQSTGSQARSPLSSLSRAQSLNQHSPGAETVSTINGKDVFERSRSSQSVTNRGGSSSSRAKGSVRTLSSSKMQLPDEESNIASLFSSPRRKKGSPKTSSGPSLLTDAPLTPTTIIEDDATERSPGAHSVSTINGKDIFERSRSSMSSRAALQRKLSPLRQQRSTEARSPSPPPQKSPKLPSRLSQVTKSTPASPKNLQSISLRIQKRNRSGSNQIAEGNDENRDLSLPPPSAESTPNPRNKDAKVEEQLTPEKKDDGQQESKPKPSPTSVVHMFGSEYPVEIDPAQSHDTDTFFDPCACDAVDDKSSVLSAPAASASSPMQYGHPSLPTQRAPSQQKLPQYPRTRSLQSESRHPPPLPPAGPLEQEGSLNLLTRPPPTPTTKKKSKAKASFSDSAKTKKPSLECSQPGSSSHSPSLRRFGPHSQSPNSPPETETKRVSPTKMFSDAYTSLEDAVAAHAAMLSGPAVRPDAPSVAGDSVAGSSVGGGSLSRSSNPEFLAKKKGAEKGEFKKVALLKKAEQVAATGGPQETIEIQALEPSRKVVQRGLAMEGDRTERKQGIEPPGIDATNTRSTSPMPSSPTAFMEETESQLSTTLLSVDVIQSFSFDQELGVQYSLSDDSWNSLSDLESIGEITICDETTRLLEAHKLYDNDALTNKNHPSRRMGSAMKVGSRFRKDSAATVISGQFDCATIPTDDTIANSNEEDGKKKTLTWYDDEENWHKPFTLKTDESFDASTVTSDKGGPVERIIRNNVVPNVNQVLGDFIKGIGRYTACGGEEDVASFDVVSGEQEI